MVVAEMIVGIALGPSLLGRIPGKIIFDYPRDVPISILILF